MEHLYIISYDISDPKRWRAIYNLMLGHGEWLQLSVFQCRLGEARVLLLEAALKEIMNQREDHVLIVDIGPAKSVAPRVHSLGKRFDAVVREPVIV
jgi:CRISPR-associated protein Cas2